MKSERLLNFIDLVIGWWNTGYPQSSKLNFSEGNHIEYDAETIYFGGSGEYFSFTIVNKIDESLIDAFKRIKTYIENINLNIEKLNTN